MFRSFRGSEFVSLHSPVNQLCFIVCKYNKTLLFNFFFLVPVYNWDSYVVRLIFPGLNDIEKKPLPLDSTSLFSLNLKLPYETVEILGPYFLEGGVFLLFCFFFFNMVSSIPVLSQTSYITKDHLKLYISLSLLSYTTPSWGVLFSGLLG